MSKNNNGWKKRLMACIMVLIMGCSFILFSSVVFAGGIDEMEPNNTFQTANTIQMNKTVFATKTNDFDYFRFTAPVSGTVNLSIKDDDTNGNITFYVLDSNNETIVWDYTNKSSLAAVIKSFGVTSGQSYYVYVSYGCQTDYQFKLTYNIGKTTINSVTPRKKGFTVKWTKKAKASFYQVQYVRKSTYSDYGWSKAKKVKVAKKYASKTISKLSAKKTYYVRVRVARTIDGNTYYSKWSPKKSVKTK